MNAYTSMLYPFPKMTMRFELENSYKRLLGIPKRFFRSYIDETDAVNMEQVQIINEIQRMITDPKSAQSLIVCGGNGTGKTHIGAGTINTLGRYSACVSPDGTQKDMQPRYVNEADLLNRCTGWGNSRDWFGEYTEECEFLVIDEFGMTQWNATDKRRIEQILNKRFSNGFKTVIMTNLDIGEVFSLLSSQLKSRLSTGKYLSLTGDDLRHADASEEPDWLED